MSYDLWLEALPGPDPVQTLRAVFPVDPATAQRIVQTLPRFVRRGMSPADAEAYRRALDRIGARYELRAANQAQHPPMSVSMPRPPSSASIDLGAVDAPDSGFDFSGSFELDVAKKAPAPPPPTPPAASGPSLDDESVDLYGRAPAKNAPAIDVDPGALRAAQGGMGAPDPMAAYGGGGLEEESVDLYGRKLDPNAPLLDIDTDALRPAQAGFGPTPGFTPGGLPPGVAPAQAPPPAGPARGPAAPAPMTTPGGPAAPYPPPSAPRAPAGPAPIVSHDPERRKQVSDAARSGRALSNDGVEGMPVDAEAQAEEKRARLLAAAVGIAATLLGISLVAARYFATDSMFTGTAGFLGLAWDGLALTALMAGPAVLVMVFSSDAAPMPVLFSLARAIPGIFVVGYGVAFGLNAMLEPTPEEAEQRRLAGVESNIQSGEFPEAGAFLFEPNHSFPGVSQADAQLFVSQLTSAGAMVYVSEYDEYSGTEYAFTLLIRMPADPALRRVLGNRYRQFLGPHAASRFPAGAQPPAGTYWEMDVSVYGH